MVPARSKELKRSRRCVVQPKPDMECTERPRAAGRERVGDIGARSRYGQSGSEPLQRRELMLHGLLTGGEPGLDQQVHPTVRHRRKPFDDRPGACRDAGEAEAEDHRRPVLGIDERDGHRDREVGLLVECGEVWISRQPIAAADESDDRLLSSRVSERSPVCQRQVTPSGNMLGSIAPGVREPQAVAIDLEQHAGIGSDDGSGAFHDRGCNRSHRITVEADEPGARLGQHLGETPTDLLVGDPLGPSQRLRQDLADELQLLHLRLIEAARRQRQGNRAEATAGRTDRHHRHRASGHRPLAGGNVPSHVVIFTEPVADDESVGGDGVGDERRDGLGHKAS